MVTVLSVLFRFVVVSVLLETVHCQTFVDDVCTLQSTKSPGVCKLFSDCKQASEQLNNYNRFPQTCGFKGNVPIVCCPTNQLSKEKIPEREPGVISEQNQPTNGKVPQREPGVISKQKCQNYSSYTYNKYKSPLLIVGGTLVITTKLGNEFPHMAVIGFESVPGQINFLCGGTIISEEYILTAGHCLSHYEHGSASYVRVGINNLSDSTHGKKIKIAQRIPYPQYNASSHYYDIGLVKLQHKLEFNQNTRAACLYVEPNITVKEAIATGWGRIKWGGSRSSNLLKVTLNLFDHDFCNSSYKSEISRKLKNGIIEDMQVCAGSITEEKDTCQGDSGGPLQIRHEAASTQYIYDILGVTSFGKACSGSPGVYSRVSYYIKWIEDIVWPQIS